MFPAFKLQQKYIELTTLIAGSGIVTAWTLFRFFTKNANFDLIGQQLLARQWLDGYLDGSVTAPTNYIVKMIFMYAPVEALGIDPSFAVITMAILVNIATFIGLVVVLKKLLGYFAIPITTIFYLSMLWLATIAGSVFWIQFTNSRNLEVVAGLWLIYMGLQLYKKASLPLGIGLTILAGVTFFADPMQLYITAMIVACFVVIDAVRSKKIPSALRVLGVLAAGYIVSLGLVWLARQVTHVEFFSVTSVDLIVQALRQPVVIVTDTAKNILRLFAGTNEMGAWRQVVNIGVVASMVALVGWAALQKRIARKPLLFVVIAGAVTLGVFVLSGQSIRQTDSSRYMIMLAPVFVFACALLARASQLQRRMATWLLVGVVCVNGISLMWSTAKTWTTDLPARTIFQQRAEYIADHGYAYGYASMDSAIVGSYLFGGHTYPLLPLSCESGQLVRSFLFYDKGVFTHHETLPASTVAVVLDGTAIGLCDYATIIGQFGEPMRVEFTRAGDTVLLYPSPLPSRN